MKPIIIFGISDFGLVLMTLLIRDGFNFYGFAVSDEYYQEDLKIEGYPVIKESDLKKFKQYDFIIAIGFSDSNRNREKIFLRFKEANFNLINYVSPKSYVPENSIIGENIIILDYCVIEPFSKIYSNTVLWSSVNISHHTTIHENCFFAPKVAVAGNVVIKNNCFLGINSTVFDNIIIGQFCKIGGGVVVKDSISANNLMK